jgi:hypothetical protein
MAEQGEVRYGCGVSRLTHHRLGPKTVQYQTKSWTDQARAGVGVEPRHVAGSGRGAGRLGIGRSLRRVVGGVGAVPSIVPGCRGVEAKPQVEAVRSRC